MPDHISNFEAHRAQLAASLSAVADSMRNCAAIADNFAKIVSDPSYSAEAAELLHGATDGAARGKRRAALSPDEDGPKKRKRGTKIKDPNAPKRPASSYILFQNDVRKGLKEQNPDMTNSELLKRISEQWAHMSEEQKESYNQLMKAAKAQYSEEKKAYDNRTPEEIEAANAAAAAALALKKANAKPRGARSGAAATAAAATAVKARPPPTADEISPTSESEEEEDSEEDEAPEPKVAQQAASDSSEESEEEEPEPAPKKRRAASAQPKGKKGSKA